MIKFILIIGLYFSTVFNTEAASSYYQLNTQYKLFYSRLQSDPQSVIDEILQHSETSDLFVIAQKQYVLSQAYYALVLPEKAIEQAQIGLNAISKNNYPWIYYKLSLSLSMAYDIAGTPSKGIDAAIESLRWAQDNEIQDVTIESLTTNGYLNLSMGQYIQSLDFLLQAYQLAKDSNDFAHQEIASIVALVYEYRKEHELSIPFFTEAAEFHRKNNNWLELSIALYGLGRANIAINNTDMGLSQLQESLDLSVQVDDHQGAGYALKELAGYALAHGDFQKANDMLLEALDAFKIGKNRLMLFDVYKVLTQLKLKTNEIELAQSHLQQAFSFINQNDHPIQHISIRKIQTELLAHSGQYEQAFKQLRKIVIDEKQLLSRQSTKQLHQLRSQFELQDKEKANKILAQDNELKNTQIHSKNQQNQILILMFLFALTVSAMLIFIALRLRKNKKHFEQLANYDSLTAIYTRSKTLQLLNDSFEQSRINNTIMCIGMIDLDSFKSINDQYGHAAGDLVLKKMGQYLSENIDKDNICGRFGGEEFVVGLINTSLDKAKSSFEKIRIDIEQMPISFNQTDIKLTLSAGFCSNFSHSDIDSMLKSADDAMYQAKQKGRNQIVYNKK
ncbi:MAG: diguanylate cyclase [Marinicellaceae bacterium]